MTKSPDKQLTELERKVQENPDDLFARFAYYSGLIRAGRSLPPLPSNNHWQHIHLDDNYIGQIQWKRIDDIVFIKGNVSRLDHFGSNAPCILPSEISPSDNIFFVISTQASSAWAEIRPYEDHAYLILNNNGAVSINISYAI